MEVDVARPAATFDYELASKDMIHAHPTNGRKASALLGVPNERRVRLRLHAGSVSGAACIRISILMQACAVENPPASAATNSESVSNDSIFLRPKRVSSGFVSFGQPDLHRIAVSLLADAGE
jgi:hypothetical protein